MTAARPILLIEDQPIQCEAWVDSLSFNNEFAANVATTLGAADTLFRAEDVRFDAVILALAMPDGAGHDYLVKLRQRGHNMPIIVVAGSCNKADVVRVLDAGANDFLVKPFRQDELLARLRAHIRIFDNSEDATFTIGRFSFRPAAKLLIDPAKRRVRLTNKENQILKFLYRAGAKSVSRPVLLEEVWGYNSGVTTHTLETHIYRLRQKMEVDPGNSQILVTETGGYRLNAAFA
jgi:DNA-binding response OmpR family regulator